MTHFERVGLNLEHARQVAEAQRKEEARKQLWAKVAVAGILVSFAVCLLLFGRLD